MNKSYSELIKFKTFKERYDYLKLNGKVGFNTFGNERYLNQKLYSESIEWKKIRNKVIVRDEGCDLGISDRYIGNHIIVHHINPITPEDIINKDPKIFDMDNLISVSLKTHNGIHYGISYDDSLDYKERRKNDTCPWVK